MSGRMLWDTAVVTYLVRGAVFSSQRGKQQYTFIQRAHSASTVQSSDCEMSSVLKVYTSAAERAKNLTVPRAALHHSLVFLHILVLRLYPPLPQVDGLCRRAGRVGCKQQGREEEGCEADSPQRPDSQCNRDGFCPSWSPGHGWNAGVHMNLSYGFLVLPSCV